MNYESTSQSELQLVPFLKWPGGKRWLAARHLNLFPAKFNTYVEPFLGSAAVYFALRPKKAVLSDVNEELINTFVTVRDSWSQVEDALGRHQDLHSEEHYYRTRSCMPRSPVARAARFIYLNRTCWNGLYRVNRKGQFNVPVGTKSEVLLGSDDFFGVSSQLKNAEIYASDFEQIIARADSGDLLFVDPPYTVKHNLNGFVKYNDRIFSWEDQIRLSAVVRRARDRGARIVMTNADHESIRTLYADFEMRQVPRASLLAGDPKGRGNTTELVIVV